ncbi:hypothetical protein [Streptomyces sp. NPDC051001]
MIAMVAGAALGAWLVQHGPGIPPAITAGLAAPPTVTASGRE